MSEATKESLIHLYRIPGDNENQLLLKVHQHKQLSSISIIKTEYCYNIEVKQGCELSNDDKEKLIWLFVETFEPENITNQSFLETKYANESHSSFDCIAIVEVGPRLAFTTAWCSNCMSMCAACGIDSISRIERSRRYYIESSKSLSPSIIDTFTSLVHDRMTECVYIDPLMSFFNGTIPAPVTVVPLLAEGKEALKRLNESKGLGFDDWDIEFYTNMFIQTLKRDPTDVECFDLAQSNSEHSRHWFFGGNMVIDGEQKKESLFSMVKATLPKESNSVIAFHDNSSALYGFPVPYFKPSDPTGPSSMTVSNQLLHPILTAETHNFPSGVAPFPGAETGTGGRLRDVQATGRGAHTLAGVSSYCVGNLHIPNYDLPWEQDLNVAVYPSNLAKPLTIEIEASNGASDYGNKYGEPVVAGFTRSFGQVLPNGERVEYIKPIMFTAGVGILNDLHKVKCQPEEGMIVCKIGGPAYRIGMGGGAASSRVQGTADVSLDFDAVQRGDAEMENRMNRVIRSCIDLLHDNPIVSIHDQGAGGNGNVLKEIVDPLGAKYDIRSIPIGDTSLSVSEIWGAEYQENNAFLVHEKDLQLVLSIGKRENCPVTAVGRVTNNGRVIVIDSKEIKDESDTSPQCVPYDLPLSLILGNMPKKTFHFQSPLKVLRPLIIPEQTKIFDIYDRVVRLIDVGSKRFLTNKVDRSVSGLIAQQQCVGSYSMPLSNVAVLSLSYFDTKGMAVAVGEQPIKGLVNNSCQARMTVAETFSNLVFAKITKISDVKMSGNWMWAAKLEGEGAKMYETCEALKETLIALGASIDGGKDSLSMAAKVSGMYVKSPGTLTLTAYAPCPDITMTITPDLKLNGSQDGLYGELILVDLSGKHCRCGGTALSTVYGQLGDIAPDLNDIELFKSAFHATQSLLEQRLLRSGHDRSDGGLIVTLAEMALSGNCGIDVRLEEISNPLNEIGQLFNEEVGWVFEINPNDRDLVLRAYQSCNVPCQSIGHVVKESVIKIQINSKEVLNMTLHDARKSWEGTSLAIERLQSNPICVKQEEESLIGLNPRKGLNYRILTKPILQSISPTRPRVAVIRQEGSNGDREMLAALYTAGADAWDVNMNDLVNDKVALNRFQGVVFCGGFSYADVNDSAKGWAGVIRFNPKLLDQFNWFKNQHDRFSLGVCNGCQLLALLGWVPFPEVYDNEASPHPMIQNIKQSWKSEYQPRFLHNESGRFESRWVTVRIESSPSVLLKDMEGSVLGVWTAHGEGRIHFPNQSYHDTVKDNGLIPMTYVDDDHNPTERYPMNPNGSIGGIAGLTSLDGRHLAIMPHPERCYQYWQWPHKPQGYDPVGDRQSIDGIDGHLLPSPWIQLFQNAVKFCNSFHQ